MLHISWRRSRLSGGRIESLLYAIGWAIDGKKAPAWTGSFFKVNALEARKLAAQKAIIAEMKIKRPEFVQQLTGALITLDTLQKQRNLLVHGLWVHTGMENAFVAYPLRLEFKGGNMLAKGEAVDLASLSKLADDIAGAGKLVGNDDGQYGSLPTAQEVGKNLVRFDRWRQNQGVFQHAR